MSSSSSTNHHEQPLEQHFIPYALENVTMWTRIKFAWSLLTLPIAMILMGRAIRIRIEQAGKPKSFFYRVGYFIIPVTLTVVTLIITLVLLT